MQQPHGRQRQTEDVADAAVDPLDQGAADPLQAVGARLVGGLAGGDVPGDHLVGQRRTSRGRHHLDRLVPSAPHGHAGVHQVGTPAEGGAASGRRRRRRPACRTSPRRGRPRCRPRAPASPSPARRLGHGQASDELAAPPPAAASRRCRAARRRRRVPVGRGARDGAPIPRRAPTADSLEDSPSNLTLTGIQDLFSADYRGCSAVSQPRPLEPSPWPGRCGGPTTAPGGRRSSGRTATPSARRGRLARPPRPPAPPTRGDRSFGIAGRQPLQRDVVAGRRLGAGRIPVRRLRRRQPVDELGVTELGRVDRHRATARLRVAVAVDRRAERARHRALDGPDHVGHSSRKNATSSIAGPPSSSRAPAGRTACRARAAGRRWRSCGTSPMAAGTGWSRGRPSARRLTAPRTCRAPPST